MTTDPRATALLDQSQAAWREAETLLRRIAELTGTTATRTKLGPLSLMLAETMAARGFAGDITLCPHLSYEHPAPANWCAYAPGKLRCASCTITVMARIRGTIEDRRCDLCRKIMPRLSMIYAAQVALPPVPDAVRERHTGRLAPIPPITMHFGVCPACRQEDGCWP